MFRKFLWMAALLPAACASRQAAPPPDGNFDPGSERGMFVALRDLHATDDQRVAVMAAWDQYQDARRAAEAKFDTQVHAALGDDRYKDWQRYQEQRAAEGPAPGHGGRRRDGRER